MGAGGNGRRLRNNVTSLPLANIFKRNIMDIVSVMCLILWGIFVGQLIRFFLF